MDVGSLFVANSQPPELIILSPGEVLLGALSHCCGPPVSNASAHLGDQELAVNISALEVKANESHYFNIATEVSNLVHGDSGRTLFWKTVNARADRRKRNTSDLEPVRHLERLAIAGSQQAVFIVISAAPDRADGVNHEFCREIVALGSFCLAGFATAQQTTLGNQARSGRAVDGAIHSASAKQRTVGRIDDRVHCLPGYVSLKNLDAEAHVVNVFQKGKSIPLSFNFSNRAAAKR